MMNQALRYERVLRYWDARGVTSALEVGSGASGLAAWWPNEVTGLDLRFDGVAPPNLKTVAGSVFDLPFPDRSHDAVVCTDVLEHLPAPRRGEALSEILRVSSRLAWVSFPCGREAVAADRRLAAAARRAGVGEPGWLLDHMQHGLPELDEALAWPAAGFRRGWAMSLPVRRHIAVVVFEHTPAGPLVDRLARWRWLRSRILGRPARACGLYRLEMWFERSEV
jgi:SAM-dependent methyltransferase